MIMKSDTDFSDFNPFPGLRPFVPEDSNLFFGRDLESDEIIMKLLKNRYISVIGASGSGKSSLVYGGVLPKILNLKIRESSVWRIISLRPGNDPFGSLAEALSNGVTDDSQKTIDKSIILSDLLTNPGSFSDVVNKYRIKHDDNVILVIDQFEELFRYQIHGETEILNSSVKKFIDFLVDSVSKPDVNIFIILTLRTEYLGECSQFKGLTTFINNSNYFVPEMEIGNWREVIEGPVKFSGVEIEPELVELILSDLKGRTDQFSVLQHALMRTWLQWQKLDEPDKPLSRADYELAGTMDNAISLHGEELYEKLSLRGREICSSLFKTITRKSSDSKELRQPSQVETIKLIAGCSQDELFEVIEKFRSQPQSFITPPENVILNCSSVIDIQNECIIRLWNRLKGWINEEDNSRGMYLRLSEAAALYQQGKSGLYRPPDLQAAIAWRGKNRPSLTWAVQYNPAFERAMVFLRTSEKTYLEEEQNRIKLQTRKVKRSRLIIRILGLAVLIAMAFIFYANSQKSVSERETLLAESRRIQAIREKEVADSYAIVVVKHNIVSDSTESAAIKDAAAAKEQKIVADIQRSFAEKRTTEALYQKSIAVEQKNGTQRLRMLSIGKSMSLRSLQMTGQKDLQALLAYQAYLFNKRNNGPDNDADIYAGLYNVALKNGSINYKSFKGHNGEIRSIAFIPGKNEFITSGNDGKVLKWSLENKDQTLQVIYSGNDIIEVLAVSPDASWLACGSSNSSIRMIPLKGNSLGYSMEGHKGGIKSLIFSYDGKFLYSAALDGKVLKWDIAARTSINAGTGSIEISSIDISSKGNYLAGISPDGNVVVWNPEHNADNFRIETGGKNIKVVRFNPVNNLLALGDANGTVELWDTELHKKISEVKAHRGQINDIQFNAVLNQMATSGNDKELKIFNIKDPADLTEPPVSLVDNEGFVLVMRFSPDGQMIISGESASENNLKSRPSNVDYLVSDICKLVSRNMTSEEWSAYVGKDIPLEKTCEVKNYNIKVEPIKSNSK
jgi:WD40 repeat protein